MFTVVQALTEVVQIAHPEGTNTNLAVENVVTVVLVPLEVVLTALQKNTNTKFVKVTSKSALLVLINQGVGYSLLAKTSFRMKQLFVFICLGLFFSTGLPAQYMYNASNRQIGKVSGDRYYDASNRLIGRVNGEMVYDGSNRKIGQINGEDIYNGSGRKIGRVAGDQLYDGSNRLIGRMNGDVIYDGSNHQIGRAAGLRRRQILLFFYFFM